MITNSQTEVVFTGKLSPEKLIFVRWLMEGAKDLRFNSPELYKEVELDESLLILNTESYVDLVFLMPDLKLEDTNFEKVFVNVGREGDEFEVLLFFDLKDSRQKNYRRSIEVLKNWAEKVLDEAKFDEVVCRLDDQTEEEYRYFDQNGFGPLFHEL